MKRRDRNKRRRGNDDIHWRDLALIALVGAVALLVGCAKAPPPSSDGIPQTGFLVEPQFTPAYEAYGPKLLGEPISGLCQVANGKQAQYFQNVRLEISADGQELSVSPLGEWAYAGLQRKSAAPVPDDSRIREFPETGFVVRDEFLDFYEENSGETFLGPPISPQLDEGALRVQYFRNARLEWRPDEPIDRRVRMGMLGQAHFLQAAHDVTCELRARPVDVTTVRDVRVLASAEAPILYTGDEQVIYAMVTTGAGVPVAGVPVSLTMRDVDWTLTVRLGRTDSEGRVQGGLQMPRFVPGRMVGVSVDAAGVGGASIGRTGLAFQTWW